MLRAHASRSPLAELETGSFRHVIDDDSIEDPVDGPPHRAVPAGRSPTRPRSDGPSSHPKRQARIALVWVEQLYPWPERLLTGIFERYQRGDRGGVAPGGAREHGCLVLRPRPPPRVPARAPAPPPREPRRVGQPRHRERRPAPVGAGRSACDVPLAEPHHVVVDGSNLATEGRTSPSLKQLDEAVRAYACRGPGLEHHRRGRRDLRAPGLRRRARGGARGHAQRGDHLPAGGRHRPRGRVRAADRRADRCHRAVQRLLPGVPRGAPLALRRRAADRRQAGARRGVDLHAPAAHPGPQEPGRHGRGQGQEGPRVRPGQGRGAGPGGQEGGQEGDQGQEGGEGHDARRSTRPGRSRPPRRPRVGPRSTPCSPAPSTRRSRRRCTRPRPQKSRDSAKKHAAKKAAPAEERQGQEGRADRGEPEVATPQAAAEYQGAQRGSRRQEEGVDPAAGRQRAAGLHQLRRRLPRRQHRRGRGGLVHLARRHGRRLAARRGRAALLHPADRHGHAAPDQGAPGAQEG